MLKLLLMFCYLKNILFIFALQMYNISKYKSMKNKINEIPIRVIAQKSNVDSRTVSKFLSNEKVQYSKEISIRRAIKEILEEEQILKQ